MKDVNIKSDIQNTINQYDKSQVYEWNKKTVRARVIEPFLNALGHSVRRPKENVVVNLDKEFGDVLVDYSVEKNGEPKIGLVFTNEIDEHELNYNSLQSFSIVILTDGIEYRAFLLDDQVNQEIFAFQLNSSSDYEDFAQFLSINSIESGLFDAVIGNYISSLNDLKKLQNKTEVLKQSAVQNVESELESIPEKVLTEGADHMIKYIERETEIREFRDTINDTLRNRDKYENKESNTNKELKSLEKPNSDDLVLIIKDSEENIDKRKNEDKATGRLVTYRKDKPEYVVFSTVEKNKVEYIAEVNSFELVETKDNDEFANNVFDMQLGSLLSLTNPIEDKNKVLESLNYVRAKDIKNVDDISEADIE